MTGLVWNTDVANYKVNDEEERRGQAQILLDTYLETVTPKQVTVTFKEIQDRVNFSHKTKVYSFNRAEVLPKKFLYYFTSKRRGASYSRNHIYTYNPSDISRVYAGLDGTVSSISKYCVGTKANINKQLEETKMNELNGSKEKERREEVGQLKRALVNQQVLHLQILEEKTIQYERELERRQKEINEIKTRELELLNQINLSKRQEEFFLKKVLAQAKYFKDMNEIITPFLKPDIINPIIVGVLETLVSKDSDMIFTTEDLLNLKKNFPEPNLTLQISEMNQASLQAWDDYNSIMNKSRDGISMIEEYD